MKGHKYILIYWSTAMSSVPIVVNQIQNPYHFWLSDIVMPAFLKIKNVFFSHFYEVCNVNVVVGYFCRPVRSASTT